jgi:hypothetical protein
MTIYGRRCVAVRGGDGQTAAALAKQEAKESGKRLTEVARLW